MGFVVEKMAMGQAFLRVLTFSPFNYHSMLNSGMLSG